MGEDKTLLRMNHLPEENGETKVIFDAGTGIRKVFRAREGNDPG